MESRIKAFIKQHGLFCKEDKILVAVSGGVDSMTLAQLLVDCGFRVGIAHCNFQLRGEDSNGDEEFVSKWSEVNRLPFHSIRIDTPKLALNSGSSIQMVARNERYAFFNSLMDEHGYVATALAHHADDRVESLIINLLRGTGVRGLLGIPTKRDRFVRPLMFANKAEIRNYLDEKKIAFREDASNLKTDYQRNWVRLRLLPMLRHVDHETDHKLLRLADRAETDRERYEAWVANNLKQLRANDDGSRISVVSISSLKAPFTLMKELLSPFGFSSSQVFEVLDLLRSQSGAQVTNDKIRVLRDRDDLILHQMNAKEQAHNLHFERFSIDELVSLKMPSNVALLDAEKVDQRSLRLRHWEQGDRFRPLGMHGWKKLSDFFIDEKMSITEKEKIWLLTTDDDIVWIIGKRLDDRFKVGPNTKKVLKVEVR